MKLGIVFLLVVSPYDHLITFAVLMVLVSVIVRLCYTIYCKRNFKECHYNKSFDWNKFREMSSYAGWTAIGTLGFTVKDQISNIILNQFFGTVVNAARGIAGQVNGIINTFASNFFMAMSPQITKQYAAGNIEESKRLVYTSAKFSFYLLGLICIPVIINMRYLLELWLVNVPEYTYEFLVITMLATLIGTFANSTTTALQATGNIKVFQIGIAAIMLLELPVAYILLRKGYSPPYALVPALFTTTLGVIYRFFLLRRMFAQYSLKLYYVDIVARCLFVFCLSFVVSWYFCSFFSTSLINVVITTAICVIVNGLFIYMLGLQRTERRMVSDFVSSKLNKGKK